MLSKQFSCRVDIITDALLKLTETVWVFSVIVCYYFEAISPFSSDSVFQTRAADQIKTIKQLSLFSLVSKVVHFSWRNKLEAFNVIFNFLPNIFLSKNY